MRLFFCVTNRILGFANIYEVFKILYLLFIQVTFVDHSSYWTIPKYLMQMFISFFLAASPNTGHVAISKG